MRPRIRHPPYLQPAVRLVVTFVVAFVGFLKAYTKKTTGFFAPGHSLSSTLLWVGP